MAVMEAPDMSFGDELVAFLTKYESAAGGQSNRDSGYWHRPDPEAFWRERFRVWGMQWPTGDPLSPGGDNSMRSRLEAFLRKGQDCDPSELDILLGSEEEMSKYQEDIASDSEPPPTPRSDDGGCAMPEQEEETDVVSQIPLWLLGEWQAVGHPLVATGSSCLFGLDGWYRGPLFSEEGAKLIAIRSSEHGVWLEVVVKEESSPDPYVIAVRPAPPPHNPSWLQTCQRAWLSPIPPDRFPEGLGPFGDLAVGLWQPAGRRELQSPRRRRGGVCHGVMPPSLEAHADWVVHPPSGLPLLSRGSWGGRLDRPDGLVVAFHALPCSVGGRWGIRRPRRLVVTQRDVMVCATIKGATQVDHAVPISSITRVWIATRGSECYCDFLLRSSWGDISVRADKQRAGAVAQSLRRLQAVSVGPTPPGQQRRMMAVFAFAVRKRHLAVYVGLIGEFILRELKVRVVGEGQGVSVPAPRPARWTYRTSIHCPWDLPVMNWDEVTGVLPTEAAIRFRLDAFYRTYTGQSTTSFGPADAAKVSGLVSHVLEGRHPIDRVLEKMCEKHDANPDEWQGRLPLGLVRFHLLAICRHFDPATEGVPPLLPKGRVARTHVVEHLARKVCAGDFALSEVVRRLCRLFGADAGDWLGEYPAALSGEGDDLPLGHDHGQQDEDGLRFLIDAFYVTISPSDISKASGLCEHVTSGRHPLKRVVAVMCEKYAADMSDWAGFQPLGPLRYRFDALIGAYDPLYEGVQGHYGAGPQARARFVQSMALSVNRGSLSLQEAVLRLAQLWPESDAREWSGSYPPALRQRAVAA
eukprot:Hpha_TRINITY_DN16123_c1_g5::TRINITY_DN16123_c1_g5_i1::g.7455::m.7455